MQLSQLWQLRTTLSYALAAVLPFGVLAPGCSPSTATKGQLITCSTDPGTGAVLRCEPGGSNGAGTCQDVDEDGDGEPHDDGDDAGQPQMADGGHDGSDDDGDDDGDRRCRSERPSTLHGVRPGAPGLRC